MDTHRPPSPPPCRHTGTDTWEFNAQMGSLTQGVPSPPAPNTTHNTCSVQPSAPFQFIDLLRGSRAPACVRVLLRVCVCGLSTDLCPPLPRSLPNR